MKKRSIAIWIHGGIGGGLFGQGHPAIQQLVKRLSRHLDIDVFSALSPEKDFHPDGFRIFSAPSRVQWRWYRWSYLIWKFMAHRFRKRYDLVYSFWGYPAGLVAVVLGKIYGTPSVIHLQGGDAVRIASLRYGVFASPVRAAICRFVYARCACIIALTSYQAACLKANGVAKDPVIIPYGPDVQQFAYRPERFANQVVQFLHVGNLTPVKGQEVMLKVFSEIANRIPSELVIVGEDYDGGRLKRLCTSLGIGDRVRFAGAQPHEAMPDFYHSADILLHTALYEGQGVVFAEAAACGTVLAGTAVGLLADMGERCGIAVAVEDTSELATKITKVLADKDELRRMREAARAWVQEKDLEYTERRVRETLTELLKP